MTIAPEHRRDFEALPAPLRALLEAELAAGNSITEVSHSHPAPPVGAAFMLARRVSTRARASGDGLRFYERNSSSYSGEFTDADRFFFILEPPLPPPPEPDMDAIRTLVNNIPASNPRSRSTSANLEPTRPPAPKKPKRTAARKTARDDDILTRIARAKMTLPPPDATQAERLHHFRDARDPHTVLCEVEADLMTLLQPSIEGGRLSYHGTVKVTGTGYSVRLTFEAALKKTYAYSLHMAVSWASMPATHHDYFRKSCVSWFNLWTRRYDEAAPTQPSDHVASRYEAAVADALKAEAHLTTVPDLQQAILAALRDGAYYSTAHKEGGTRISWEGRHFVRADYGESDKRESFAEEAAFLEFLRRFYDYETSRNSYPERVPELDAWRLMLRLLRRA